MKSASRRGERIRSSVKAWGDSILAKSRLSTLAESLDLGDFGGGG
jgi:hypothetical protein